MNSSRIVLAVSLILAFEGAAHADAIPPSRVVAGPAHSSDLYPHLTGRPQPVNSIEPIQASQMSLPDGLIPPVLSGVVKPPYTYWWSDGPNAYVDLDNAGVDYGTLLSSNWSQDCGEQKCMKEDAAVGFSLIAPESGTLSISVKVSVEWFYNIMAAAYPWDSNSVSGRVNLYLEDTTAGIGGGTVALHVWNQLYNAKDTGYYWSNGWSNPNPHDPLETMYCTYNAANYKTPVTSGIGSGQAFWGCSENNDGTPVTNWFNPIPALEGVAGVVEGHVYTVWIWSSIDGSLGPTGGATDTLFTNVGETLFIFN